MESFYCVGCRFSYPLEKAGHLTNGAHRDGAPVGFCFVCTRELLEDGATAGSDATPETAIEVGTSEPAASA